MKKLLLLISIFITSTSAFSQSENSEFSLNPETGEIYYSEVINLEGKSKDDLYLYANSWFVDAFVSAKNVIQYSDKKEGVIIGKWYLEVKNGKVEFTAKIGVKEGRYKYELYGFNYKPSPGGIRTHGDLRQDKPGGGMYAMWRSHWTKARNQSKTQISSLISSLIEGMSSKDDLKKDDW